MPGAACHASHAPPVSGGAFDLRDAPAYQHWRAGKLADRARSSGDLVVDLADPRAPSPAEAQALRARCARWNMAVYRSAPGRESEDRATMLGVARALGLVRLDANWLADDDGISSITVREDPRDAAEPGDGHGAFIPYTDRPIRWHTDGYYHERDRQIRAMVLHCVRPALRGGDTALLDHELAYIALRDREPRWIEALMAPAAMTIPARADAQGEARAARSGPVFSVDGRDGALHMRYTARTRSIEWAADAATREAAAFLAAFLSADNAQVLRLRLDAGMGIVANNVLHERTGFADDPACPRLVYRARYLDRIAPGESKWRSG